ncbi:MAG: hypothetical protein ACRD3S_06615, partial [Terracidiphilus sp.]
MRRTILLSSLVVLTAVAAQQAFAQRNGGPRQHQGAQVFAGAGHEFHGNRGGREFHHDRGFNRNSGGSPYGYGYAFL